MGNCTCSTVKEENESQYDVDYLDNVLGEIMDDILSPPYRPRAADFMSELDEDDYDYDEDDDDHYDGSESDIFRDISFERNSNISMPKNIFIDDDLCGICAFNFDDDQHVPKILPCGHTFCYYCIRKMAKRYKFKFLKCPLDRKKHILKKQHIDHIFIDEEPSSTASIASTRIGLVLDYELFHQRYNDIEDDTEDEFDVINIDTSSNEVNEGNFFDLNTLTPNLNTSEPDSQILDKFSTKSDCMTSKYAVHHSYVESEDTYSDENESEIGTLNTNQPQQQQQPLMYHRKRGHSWSEEYEEYSDTLSEFSDTIYFRQKLRPETKDVISYTDQDDIYADERSVRSFEWIEPDYD